MSKWQKWTLMAALIALPTLGFAVTKYRNAHRACAIKAGADCPCNKH